MRLLTLSDSNEIILTRNFDDNIPVYAILSHTWAEDNEDEVIFSEVETERGRRKKGYKKIQFCVEQARKDGIEHCWVDTCCINKDSHSELSEAITSMFRWYQHAAKCYVYLSDVRQPVSDQADGSHHLWESSFSNSRWFGRGWTLQELIAPQEVVFFSQEGSCLGTKHVLGELLHKITSIPITALGGRPMSSFSVDERMRWTQGRLTKRKEDQAYCLFGIFGVYLPLIYGEGDHAFVRLTEAITKTPRTTLSLRVAKEAEFDAYGQAHQGCHPATRVDLLRAIREWALNESGKGIFWLSGMAGTGKSTISCTTARWLAGLDLGGPVSLGATFFFKRNEGDRASAATLFPTIVNQLAARISYFDVFVAQAVKLYPQICSKSLAEQFKRLICEPLQRLPTDVGHSTYVIVVDALDECDNETDIRTVLQLWSTLPSATGARLRLFLTSRPELVIRLGFKKMSNAQYQDTVLHEVPRPVIEHDIHTFLSDAMADIRKEYNLEPAGEELTGDWPGSALLNELTSIAVPLFIVAATICRFVRDADRPQEGLDTILASSQSTYLSDMGSVYKTVLFAMTKSARDKTSVNKLYLDFQLIVGTIICLAEPLSRRALATLINVSTGDIQLRLRSLHALLHIPVDENAVIRPLHLSFGEYLTSQAAQHEKFAVNATLTHQTILQSCLRLLSGPGGLREDVCGLGHPGQLRSDVTAALIHQGISPAVQYACRYWVHHVQSSALEISDGDEIHLFLQQHFLHWLEMLSLLDRLADAIELTRVLQHQVKLDKRSDVAEFLEDGRRFLLANRALIELTPLQVYSSALAFAPQESFIRRQCGPIASWIQQSPITAMKWGHGLQELAAHTDRVYGVAISSNGLLASASADNTVRLWQISTGQEIQKLEGHTDVVSAVVFSPDGALIASTAADRTVRLWQVNTGKEAHKHWHLTDTREVVALSPNGSLFASISQDETVQIRDIVTGQEMKPLGVLHNQVYRGAFSSDGALVALIFRNRTMRIWQVATGQEIQEFQDNDYHKINAAAFSPDSSLIATASIHQTIRVWEVRTGNHVQECKGHTDWVTDVAFSSDGKLLASASDDRTVRLWRANTGEELQKLEGHSAFVTAVTFSPDGLLLASGSLDGTVRLWQVDEVRNVHYREGHPDIVETVVFSHDGKLLATTSNDDTVRLWQVSTGKEVRQLKGHKDMVETVAFSYDDSLLASGSSDETIRIWQVDTGQEIFKFESESGAIEEVTFSPNGILLAFNSSIGPVYLRNLSTGQVRKLGLYDGLSYSVLVFSSDSTRLAARAYRKEGAVVHIWHMSTNREVGTPELIEYDVEPGFSSEILTFIMDQQELPRTNRLCKSNLGASKALSSPYVLRDDWVEYQGRKLLRIPLKYEPTASAIFGSTIAIGDTDGHISILKLSYP